MRGFKLTEIALIQILAGIHRFRWWPSPLGPVTPLSLSLAWLCDSSDNKKI
jgi:hypothetical protein